MVIYSEYLFMENFLTGGLLLILTAGMAGDRPGRLRILMGGLLSGAGGFTIFMPIWGVTGAVVRLALAAAVCTVVFAEMPLKPKKLLKRTAVFLALTFLSGGAAMAFTLWRQTPSVSGNGALYMEPLTYGGLVMMAVPAFAVTFWFIKLVKERRMEHITRGKVCLTIKEQVYSFEALVDSGNSLREPFSGRPAVLIDRKGASRLPFSPEDAETGADETLRNRFVIVPYRTVGMSEGFLKGIRTDRVIFGEKELKGAVLAFYEGDFGDFEVLMSREVLDEGII